MSFIIIILNNNSVPSSGAVVSSVAVSGFGADYMHLDSNSTQLPLKKRSISIIT